MAQIVGITSDVSWAGTQHASLTDTGVEGREFTLNLAGEEFDTTIFGATGPTSNIKGLRSGEGTYEALLKVPDQGAAGLVTFSGGTVINVMGWDMELNREEHETTIFNATVPTWRTFLPGLWSWNGTFTGYLDDTTALTAPGNANEPATGTFRYQEKGATDSTLSGSIFTTAANVGASPRRVNSLDYTFRGSGALTQSTPSAGVGIFPNGAVGNEAAQTLTLTASTGRTFTGSAFWRSISISCRMSNLVTIRVGFRFTGEVTIG